MTDAQRLELIRERVKLPYFHTTGEGKDDVCFLLSQLDVANKTIADNECESSYWRNRAMNAESQLSEKNDEIQRFKKANDSLIRRWRVEERYRGLNV